MGAQLKPDQIWQTALGEMQLQLTGATYNTWLGRTNLVAYENDTFVIGVHNEYAKDWLENRLVSMVKRTLVGIVGRSVEVRFVVWRREGDDALPSRVEVRHDLGTGGHGDTETRRAEAEPSDVAEERPARRDVNATCDTHKSGWTPISHYENFFWGAYLGKYAFAVWRVMRGFDRRGRDAKLAEPWTPPKKISAPKLAAMCGCTKQRLLGVTRRAEAGQPGAVEIEGGWAIHTTGAFDVLIANEVARISKVGRLPRFRYQISVMWKLPLLSPDQSALIPPILQDDHDNFLESLGLDLRAWERGEVTDVT